MPFVKLDCDILRSTLWLDREARDVFITALLLAEPRQITEPLAQIRVGELEETGWVVPPGWYGFVPASGPGLIHMSGCQESEGMAALHRLGEPENESRSRDFAGRRLVRVDGGFIVLNFMKYRDKDFGAAERMRLLRLRKKGVTVTANTPLVTRNTVTVTANSYVGRVQSAETYNGQAVVVPPVSPERRAELDEITACEATCREYMALTGKAMDEVLWQFSEVGGKRLVRLDTRNANWLRVTHDRIRAALIEARQEKRKPAGEDPLVKIRRIEAAREARMKGGVA